MSPDRDNGFATRYAPLLTRWALAAGFLSAVADRLGVWGPPGATNVAWGDFDAFLRYTARINPYFPAAVIPAIAWFVTSLEVLLGVTLIAGIYVRQAGFVSGCLLLAFAFAMTVGTGVKTALDASVPAAAAGAFLLATWYGDAAHHERHGVSGAHRDGSHR